MPSLASTARETRGQRGGVADKRKAKTAGQQSWNCSREFKWRWAEVNGFVVVWMTAVRGKGIGDGVMELWMGGKGEGKGRRRVGQKDNIS